MALIAWIRRLWRLWRVKHALYDDQPDRHPALAQCARGEILVFKGTTWRIGDIREQPVPALILVPCGETRASKLRRLKELRRRHRIFTKLETQNLQGRRRIS